MDAKFMKWVRETCGVRGDAWLQTNMERLKLAFAEHSARAVSPAEVDRYKELE